MSLEKVLFMSGRPPAVLFAGIDSEPGDDAAAAESLIELFGFHGDTGLQQRTKGPSRSLSLLEADNLVS